MFEHCLSPSQHSSCCLPLCPIFAFSPCKCNKCVMRVVFQPAKPASTPWCWHFTFDSAPWNPARSQAPTFPGCRPRPRPGRGQDRYQRCHRWHHRWRRAPFWLLLNVISFRDASNWTTIVLGNTESSPHFLTFAKRAKSSLSPISSLPLPSYVTAQVTQELACDNWHPIQMVWRGSLCKGKNPQSKIFCKTVSDIHFISVSLEC